MAGFVAESRKAIIAALTASAAVIYAKMSSGTSTLTEADWISVVVSGLVAGILVYLLPNKPPSVPMPVVVPPATKVP